MERPMREQVAQSPLEPQNYGDSDQFRLLDAEAIIFDKFDEVVRRKQHLEPEKDLMLAILEDGISCFQKQLFARGHRGKNMFREAEAWIFERDTDQIFSFEGICDTLGISPSYLRAGLIAWKNRQLQCASGDTAMSVAADLQVASAVTGSPRIRRSMDGARPSGARSSPG